MSPSDLSLLLVTNLPKVDHRGEIIEKIGEDSVELRLPVVSAYLSHDLPVGSGQVVLSGPITIGFAETSMYACVHAFYGAQVLAVTLGLNISFFRVAGAADLMAVARLLKQGRTTAFVEVYLYSGAKDKPCAHATATYSIQEIAGARVRPNNTMEPTR